MLTPHDTFEPCLETEIFEELGHVHHSLRRPRRRHLVRRHADTVARCEDSRTDPCAALRELRFRGGAGLWRIRPSLARVIAVPPQLRQEFLVSGSRLPV